MKPLSLLVAMIAALLLSACSQEPAPPEKPQPTPAEKPAETAKQEMRQTLTAVEQEARKEAADVKQNVEQEVAAVKQVVTKGEAELKQDAATVAREVASAAEKAKQALPSAPAPVSSPAATTPQPPGTVTYAATMGKVSFDHAGHSQKFACSRCHPTDPPEKIAMSKEVAHTRLCKVCHKEQGGQAPTACAGCHQK